MLITTDESSNPVLDKIAELDGVKSICRTAGAYDYVVEVSADSEDVLREIITWKIRKLSYVKSSLTLLKVDKE